VRGGDDGEPTEGDAAASEDRCQDVPQAGEIGTWATNSLEDEGLIFAVDGLANEFSDWGDGRETDAQLSLADDGAEESRECVEG
jgi:hypothetical protein